MKRWTIRRQLSALIAAICLVAVVGQVIFTQLSFRKGFASYVEELNRPRLEAIASSLAENYDETLGWELMANDRRLWGDIAINPAATAGRTGERDPGMRPPPGAPPPMSPPSPGQSLDDFPSPAPLFDGERGGEGGIEDEVEGVSRGILPPGVLPQGLRPGPPPPGGDGGSLVGPRGADLALIDGKGLFIAGNREVLDVAQRLDIPVTVGDEIVGYLLSPGGMQIANEVDDAFSEKLIEQSAWIGIVVALLAVVGAVIIAKQFSRPVFRLNEGTDQLMRGNYEYELTADGPLEFGLLEQKFNRLAQTLAANRTSQQNWIANISHELRTPLAILQAELDAMSAGIREFGPAELKSLIEESKRLGLLIDDLFMLSRADAGDLSYQFVEVDLRELVNEIAEDFQEKVRLAELELEVWVPTTPVIVIADADRLRQLFANLVNNSCAYTDAGGKIRLKLKSDRKHTFVEVEDSAPGVSSDEREKIFDRLYRADKSRNRSKGGSGLGLSICRAIAEAHGAQIEASDSVLGGVAIRVSF